MKIAVIGQKGIPSKSGGVEKHVEDLAVNLAKKGQEVFVYNRSNYNKEIGKTYKGVNIITLPSINNKYLDAIFHTFISILHVSFKRVDVVHIHSIGPGFLTWLLKLLKPNTPIIFTFHCQDYFHQKWGNFARKFLKSGEYIANKLADEVIAVSKELTEYSKSKYNRDVFNIPNSVEIPEIKEAKIIKEKWGLEKNNYIVTISRLVRHKGIHYLIEAFNQIDTNKKLVIVGGSAYTDDYVNYLHQLASDNKNIILTGQQSGETLKELFSNPYLFVQPSEEEGLSIGLLEAMSYKNACLVSNISPNLEAVGDTGFVFENKSVSDLKSKLEKLLKNEEEVNKRKNLSLERIENNFTWDINTEKIINVYKNSIISKHKILKNKFEKKLENK
ncbi:glycosyltransferase [bacterium]|nr:glycosyltransferase [bacterium]